MIGTSLGPYEIIEPLGAGGMGEVYRARDTQLDRDVALKVLPAEFAADADRLARFQQEAKTLASLNHPNIAQVFGLERGDLPVIVMELVEGRDLSRVLDAGPLPLDDALAIARQVAEALAAAHDAGVVHRDLKPANVQVRDDGTVKVLDFGLAKAREGTGSADGALSRSPTIMSPAVTATGVILGTAAYMSPEQAKSRPVDRRADLWAFGCVLYEMLTGTRPFRGDDVAETMASVIKDEVDFDALPPGTPTSVRRLLERCLCKDPAMRLDSAAAARLEILAAGEEETGTAAVAAPATARGRLAAMTMGLLLGAALTAPLMWWMLPSAAHPRVVGVPHDGTVYDARISPDGRYVAMPRDPAGLYLRELETGAVELIAQDALAALAWAPDASRLAYASDAKIWVYTLSSGSAVAIADRPPGPSSGLSWGDDDRLVGAFFSPIDGAGLWAFDANRPGEGEIVVPADSGGILPLDPVVLPGGAGILYSVYERSARGVAGRIELFNGKESRTLLEEPGASIDHVIYSPAGYLVYRRGGDAPGVWARPFSLDTLSFDGPAVRLSDHDGPPSLSDDGVLLLAPAGPSWLGQESVPGVQHADGRHEPLGVPAPAARWLALAPDGERAAIASNLDGLIVEDFGRSSAVVVAPLAGFDNGRVPFWHPDGEMIGYPVMAEDGSHAILFVDARGGGFVGETLEEAYDGAFAPDGEHLAFIREGRIWVGDRFGRDASLFPSSAASVDNLDISPDGRFVVYQVGRAPSGAEVFVERFPEGGDRVALGTGNGPRFGAGGRSVFSARLADNRSGVAISSVAFDPDAGALTGEPRTVLVVDILAATRNFNVLPDGRVVTLQPVSGPPSQHNILLIEDWQRLLQRER